MCRIYMCGNSHSVTWCAQTLQKQSIPMYYIPLFVNAAVGGRLHIPIPKAKPVKNRTAAKGTHFGGRTMECFYIYN